MRSNSEAGIKNKKNLAGQVRLKLWFWGVNNPTVRKVGILQLGLIYFINVSSAGTREAAFTHAIMSAGITYSVTDACTQGNLTQCGCDTSLKNGQESAKGWKWGGCSVDIDFGTKFAERFMAARGHDRRIGLMNHHNSRAGREVSQAFQL